LVTITHVVVLAATLCALLCLPCLVAVIICADDLLDRAAWTRGRRRQKRALRRLDRSLDKADLNKADLNKADLGKADFNKADLGKTDAAAVPDPDTETAIGPTIEQIAADLRRLDRQRRGGVATESTAWLAAVLRAYDDRLRLASRCLGVAEHLEMLDGLDREIERIRVEGELQTAGLLLRSVAHRPPDRLP
jgi:hypothetical protein